MDKRIGNKEIKEKLGANFNKPLIRLVKKVIMSVLVLLPVIFTTVCSSVEKEEGLVAYWSFDEGVGSVVYDKSENELDGNIIGATWVKDKFGNGLKFEGVGSYVFCGNDERLKITGDITIIGWIKLTAPTFPDASTNWTIVNGGEIYHQCGFIFRVDGQATKLYYRTNQSGGDQNIWSNMALQNNIFYHIVLTKKGNTATIFIDGLQDSSSAIHDPIPSTPFTISHSEQPFSGIIDELRIYNRALSKEEIMSNYKEIAEHK